MGLDVGSTTVKLVILDEKLNILYKTYRRHFSDVRKTIKDVINEVYPQFKYDTVTVNVTGSGGFLFMNSWGLILSKKLLQAGKLSHVLFQRLMWLLNLVVKIQKLLI